MPLRHPIIMHKFSIEFSNPLSRKHKFKLNVPVISQSNDLLFRCIGAHENMCQLSTDKLTYNISTRR